MQNSAPRNQALYPEANQVQSRKEILKSFEE